MNHHTNKRPLTAIVAKPLAGEITVAGDKSISHRALMLGSQVLGTVHINGLLEGEDVLRTAAGLRECGVNITQHGAGRWSAQGVGIGGLSEPKNVLDMGNSGTGVRLMMGLLTPYSFASMFTGDESLRKRPMGRVTIPLAQMGAIFTTREGGRLPLVMQGAQMALPIHYILPVASAQVKSAVLFAALNTQGTTTVIEKEATRDHTERMMRYFGMDIESEATPNGGTMIHLNGQPKQARKDYEFTVPADPSSAAFLIVAALIIPHSHIVISNVCINPLRTGLFDTLREMGADISYLNTRDVAGETVADIEVHASTLSGVSVPASRAPSMIDEYPILCVAAACAKGRTIMQGLAELRVKESNRLSAMIEGLHACGVESIEQGDDLIVTGRGTSPRGGSTIATYFDHRIAMSFLVMGLVSTEPVTVDDTTSIATSFPNFIALMQYLGAQFISPSVAPSFIAKPRVIAVDGPAASGKGTLARRLADYYGMAYLDTGSLYRAAAMRLVYAGRSASDIAAAIAAARAVQEHDLANPKLRQEHISKAASVISAYPEVREALLEYQQKFAAREHGAVLDGRDIGTVICPDADVKLFITASLDTRAERRHRELQEQGIEVVYDSVLKELVERDKRDAERSVAPMIAAADALMIDTSTLSANEVFEQVLRAIEAKKSPESEIFAKIIRKTVDF